MALRAIAAKGERIELGDTPKPPAGRTLHPLTHWVMLEGFAKLVGG